MDLYTWCCDVLLSEGCIDALIVENMAYDFSRALTQAYSKIGSGDGSERVVATMIRKLSGDAVALTRKHKKPILFVARDAMLLGELAKAGVPAYPSPARAARCLARMAEYKSYLEKAVGGFNRLKEPALRRGGHATCKR